MLKLTRPLNLLLVAFTYLLGASIPAYLGKPFLPIPFTLGLLAVILAQISMAFLGEVFRPRNEPLLENETPQKIEDARNIMMYLSIGMLGTYALLVFILYINHSLSTAAFIFFLASIVLILANTIHPFRLVDRGFGEMIISMQIAYNVPSVAFLLQAGDHSPLLTILILPLTGLCLAYFLVLNFTTFQSDQKYERATLLRSLTWQRAVPFHRSLIIFSYLVFAFAPLLGYSFNLIWPAFLTLPFAIFQIIQLRAIADGAPPNWRLLTSTALSVFGLTTYFLTLTFWLR